MPETFAVLTIQELCQRWDLTPGTLAKYRRDGKGPKFFRPGDSVRGKILYRLCDVEDYEANLAAGGDA